MENQTKDNAGTPTVESLVKRGYLFLEDSEWNKADEYFDKALDINPEHAPAYIGKLCVELRVRREESLGDYKELRQGKKFDKLLGEYRNFQKALRFADDGYKKKLNDYDQKIKENFPKVPKGLTDESIKSEIARLEKEIANCDAEIAEGEGEKLSCESMMEYYKEQNKIIYDVVYRVEGHTGAQYHTDNDKDYQSNKKTINDFMNKKNVALKHVKEYTGKKAGFEANKQEIEQLARISCLDRMDVYYNRVVEAMKKASTEDDYKNFAKQFRSLEGYKDSAELADRCDKFVEKLRHEKQVKEEKEAKEKIDHKAKFTKYQKCIASASDSDSSHALGLVADGTVVATGKNEYSQCNVRGWRGIVAVAAGSWHTLGLVADGTVIAVGRNDHGQCNVNDWRNITAIAAGSSHTVGLKSDGTVIAVGRDNYGQCDVSGWRDIVAVAASFLLTVGLKADGTVVETGKPGNILAGSIFDTNNFNMGNVNDWRNITAIATSSFHTVGLKSDGTVVAINNNNFGQCNVSDWRNITAIAAGPSFTVGLKADGTVVAVGNNKTGRCNVSDWRDIVAVTACNFTIGLKVDGTVVAAGINDDDQCNVSGWRNIGLVSEEQLLKWKQPEELARFEKEKQEREREKQERERKAKAEQEAKEAEERKRQWQAKGLCKYCGGKLSGLFTKKCTSCGKVN